MYVTRPLSHYKKFPETLALPPEGPNSGYLVIQDEESENYTFFGLIKDRYLQDLPFPQNKELTICYRTTHSNGPNGASHSTTYHDEVLLIPVLNQSLSSNRYYAIKPHGNHKGEAFTCSREEDKQMCCFCLFVSDIKPRPFDPLNVYQQFQFEIKGHHGLLSDANFQAKSIAPDGFPPKFLRRKHWTIKAKTPKHYQLREAAGLNASLRQVLPGFDHSESVVIGKWYTPFMFIKEGTLRDQIKRSVFYEITLERKWEKIFSCQNSYNEGNSVAVDVTLETEIVYVSGNKAVRDDSNVVNGEIWFRNFSNKGEESSRIGLRVELVERMKWEQERGGWVGAENNEVRVQRVEEFGEKYGWKEFGCYVLVESFVLKRMDETLAISYDFRHTNQVISKWE